MDKYAYNVAQGLQTEATRNKDSIAAGAGNKKAKGVGQRRNTVHNLIASQKAAKKEEPLDLEKRFRQNLLNMGEIG